MLCYKNRLVIPRISKLISKIHANFQFLPVGGDFGETKTYQWVQSELFLVGMKKDVADFVRACSVCQQHKYQATMPTGSLQPIPLPAQVWEELTIDFMVGLPHSKGVDTILVVVDRLSKYAHYVGLRHPFKAISVVALFDHEMVRLHGVPYAIISD